MKRLGQAAPWIVLCVLILRLPGLLWGILGIDDSDFTVIARAMAHGEVPYRDIVDIKPPLAFVCYLPNAWFGEALWPVQVEGVIVVVATALILGVAARRTWGSDGAAVCAAALAVAAGLCEAPTVSTELLMNLPTAAALAVFARSEEESREQDDLIVGVLVGIASLIRHQAIFTLGALGLAVVLFGTVLRQRSWFRRCLLLAAGVLLPWFATIAAFRALGALPEFVDWVLIRNIRYVGESAGSAWFRLAQSLAVCVFASCLLPWLMGSRAVLSILKRQDLLGQLAEPQYRLRIAWTILLVVSCVPVSLGGRFYEHYFLQFVPPLALLGAGPLEALLARWKDLPSARRAGWISLAVLPAIGSLAYSGARGVLRNYPLQNPQVQAIGTWLRRNSSPADRLFVWGHFSPIYLAAGRLPGTRYVTTSWQLGNFDPEHIDDRVDLRRFRSDRDTQLTMVDLKERRPEWIIDTAPANIHSWHKLPLSLLPDLESQIASGWKEVTRAGGARLLHRF